MTRIREEEDHRYKGIAWKREAPETEQFLLTDNVVFSFAHKCPTRGMEQLPNHLQLSALHNQQHYRYFKLTLLSHARIGVCKSIHRQTTDETADRD